MIGAGTHPTHSGVVRPLGGHDANRGEMFVGPDCGLCKDSEWNVQIRVRQ